MTDIWLTPPHVLAALGGADSFDLDPCASEDRPWPTARRHLTWRDNGLAHPWDGRVWLNPPYSRIGPWLGKLAAHGRGVALVFAKTDTEAFAGAVFGAASALFFVRRRLQFYLPDGTPSNTDAASPSVLCAYGVEDADVLASLDMRGDFVPLRIPRIFAVAGLEPTWSEIVGRWLRTRPGPVSLAEIYQAFARHPKARRNPNFEAKIRQVLQQGAGQRVDRGIWSAA